MDIVGMTVLRYIIPPVFMPQVPHKKTDELEERYREAIFFLLLFIITLITSKEIVHSVIVAATIVIFTHKFEFIY